MKQNLPQIEIVPIGKIIEVPQYKNLYANQPDQDLTTSYRQDGQKGFLYVNSRYELINGYRSLSAMKAAGFTSVKVVVMEGEPTIYDRILLNKSRIKTSQDKVTETRLIYEKIKNQQGKRNPNKEKYRRHEIISKYLNNRWTGDKAIQKLEYILNNDIEGDILSKGVLDKNWKIESCHQFLKELKEIDQKKNWGFTRKLTEESMGIEDINKLILQKMDLDSYQDTFVIPTKVASYNRNCLDLSKMDQHKNTVDLLLTSPPYFILRKYSNGDPNQIGHEKTKEEYCENVSRIIAGLVPTLKETANVIINIGETYDDGVGYGIPQLLKAYIEKNTSLIYKDTLVWSKPNPKPQNETVKRPINNVEYLLWFVVNPKLAKYNLLKYSVEGRDTKTSKGCKDVDKNGVVWDKNISLTKPYKKIYSHLREQTVANIIECTVGQNHDVYKIYEEGHPAIMSAMLPVVPILMTTNEGNCVFDCFSGSNVVGRISTLLNRSTLSAELSKEYFKIGCKMLENATKEFERNDLDIINGEIYLNDKKGDQQISIAA